MEGSCHDLTLKFYCQYYTKGDASVTFQHRYYVHYKQKFPLFMKNILTFCVNITVYSTHNLKKKDSNYKTKVTHVTKNLVLECKLHPETELQHSYITLTAMATTETGKSMA
jgi:hypothetical protein